MAGAWFGSMVVVGHPREEARMRGQHLRRALGSDHRANTDFNMDAETPAQDGDVSAAWAVAFVVCALLALASPFL